MNIFLGIALIAVPILFNVAFASLAKQFEYPDILRKPTTEVLEKFRAGGSRLVNTWWAFAMSALLFGLIAVLVPYALALESWQQILIATLGLLASLVQFLGLVRWPFMVPHLAREAKTADKAKLAAIDVVFQSLNRYLGVAVGEHLGYLFTGLWTLVLAIVLFPFGSFSLILAISGALIGVLLVVCSLEFVGKNEEHGWRFAGTITPFVYIAWSLWLIALGVNFFTL